MRRIVRRIVGRLVGRSDGGSDGAVDAGPGRARAMLAAALALALASGGASGGAAGAPPSTPEPTIPAPTIPAPTTVAPSTAATSTPAASAAVSAPPAAGGWPAGVTPTAPPGFRVRAFARALDAPRNVVVLPNSDVLVAEGAGRVTLLRDVDRDGVADQRHVVADDLDLPFGLAMRRDRLYVGTATGVVSCPFFVGQTRATGACRSLVPLPAEPAPRWRNVAFSPDESTLYVALGAPAPGATPSILAAKPDGTGVRTFASGLSDATGLAFDTTAGRLWTNVADAIAPAAGGTAAAAVEFGADAAPLGLQFYRRQAFPAEYLGGAFVSLRGAGAAPTAAGHRVAFVPFAQGRPAGAPREFLGGFVDPATSTVRGRPAGLAQTKDGALLVADDVGHVIWHVAR